MSILAIVLIIIGVWAASVTGIIIFMMGSHRNREIEKPASIKHAEQSNIEVRD